MKQLENKIDGVQEELDRMKNWQKKFDRVFSIAPNLLELKQYLQV